MNTTLKQLSILTTIEANHGSCIFNAALNKMLTELLPHYQVNFLRSLTPSWYAYEMLRALKPQPRIPLYNLKRYSRLMRSSKELLDIEPFFSPGRHNYKQLMQELADRQKDALVVAKVVWDIAKIWQTPNFPNVFWLSEKLPAIKMAYAVSAHRTDMSLFRQHKEEVLSILSSYAMIGVRDDITLHMLREAGVDQHTTVQKVLDPAFFYQPRPVNTRALLNSHGIDVDRPILGMLFYGKPELSKAICEHYHQCGFQIINFNMYNPWVDLNLGHLVDAFEWAALFEELDFCITDRFHCSVMCIRNKQPFIGIEPYKPLTLENSKVRHILKDFDLLDAYQNTLAEDFNLPDFFETCQHMEDNWDASYAPRIEKLLPEKMAESQAFLQAMADRLA
jgi:Polysaccharide pyruvyl transferase